MQITAIITGTAIRVEMRDLLGTVEQVFTEPRPATFAHADTALAAHGFGRIRGWSWNLGEQGTVTAQLQVIDNRFNGTRAARLDQAIGTTHGKLETVPASSVNNGDIITDLEECALYVVAGSNPGWNNYGPAIRVHMVGEGKVWDDRYTTDFPAGQLVKVARRKA